MNINEWCCWTQARGNKVLTEFKLSLVEWVRFRETSMNKGRLHEKDDQVER